MSINIDLQNAFHQHTHNGADSKRLSLSELDFSIQDALTGEVAGSPNTGDATTDNIISRNRTRIGEIETALQNLGLLS